MLVGVLVMMMVVVVVDSQPLQVTGSLCTPTTGGSTSLTGIDFNAVSSLSVSVGTFTCLNARTLTSDRLTCLIPEGQGAGFPISVNGVQGAASFSYCPPTISSVSVVSRVTNQSFVIMVQGENFGNDSSRISITFRRPNDISPSSCTNVTLTVPHKAFTCELGALKEGEYFPTLMVAAQGALPSSASFTVGNCYQRDGLSTSDINLLLQKVALQKGVAKMKSLLETLRRLRASLPDYEGNSCCASEYSYPLPQVELQLLSSLSFSFKDCLDGFCDQRELFLSQLATTAV